jgi:hypothetical protein
VLAKCVEVVVRGAGAPAPFQVNQLGSIRLDPPVSVWTVDPAHLELLVFSVSDGAGEIYQMIVCTLIGPNRGFHASRRGAEVGFHCKGK